MGAGGEAIIFIYLHRKIYFAQMVKLVDTPA